MKKVLFLSFIFTMAIIFVPPFMVPVENLSEPKRAEIYINSSYMDPETTYSINKNNVKVFDSNDGSDKVKYVLKKSETISIINKENGYYFCKDSSGRYGWINESSLE